MCNTLIFLQTKELHKLGITRRHFKGDFNCSRMEKYEYYKVVSFVIVHKLSYNIKSCMARAYSTKGNY